MSTTITDCLCDNSTIFKDFFCTDNQNKLPGGRIFINEKTKDLNKQLNDSYNVPNLVVYNDNYQVTMNHFAIDSAKLNQKEILNRVMDFYAKDSAIALVFPVEDVNIVQLPATIRKMLNNSYFKKRSGDIQLILKPAYIDALSKTGTTHGLWNPYDAHIPLLWYGWGIKAGKTNREIYMSDIAPTIAAMLHIQMPSGCIGNVITEALK